MGVVADARIRTDVMYRDKDSKWRADIGAELPTSQNDFFYLGVSDAGGDDDFNSITTSALASSLWAVLASWKANLVLVRIGSCRPNSNLFTDYYDFNDGKLKVGAEWAFSPKLSLIGENMDVLDGHSDLTYLGLRARF